MRVLIVAAPLVLACPPLQAQSGPLEPRLVAVAMPMPTPSPNDVGTLRIVLDFEVAPDGRVTAVKELNSSGDPKFDEKVRKYGMKFRLIPALSEDGTPVAGVYKFILKSTEMLHADPAALAEGQPSPTTVSLPAAGNARTFDEVGRINRMRCKDFLWEYDLMKEIAGSRPIYNERMFRTTLAMFIVQEHVAGNELNALNMAFSGAVRDSVDQCRHRPDDKYFQDVLTPTLKKKLG
jgi:TonB family protein